mmetsp:Transcript_2163/g.3215  ORF Transcript_2163/g.3215 Transcript_2163/m.3215 type:complete len:311 (+) Transcript_2163:60-992(+)
MSEEGEDAKASISEKLEEGKNEGEATTSAGEKQKEAVLAGIDHILKRDVSDALIPYFGILCMAVVQCIAIATQRSSHLVPYGLILSITSIVLSVGALIVILLERSNHQKDSDQPEFYASERVVPGYPIIMKAISYFLLLWNFIGTCIMTFGVKAPFRSTGNGYFGSWGVVISSFCAVGITMDTLQGTFKGLNFQIGLLMSCFLVFIESITVVAHSAEKVTAIFALIISILTCILIPVFLFLEHKKVEKLQMIKFPVWVIFAIVWFFEACFATFDGPFIVTGNGYFGSWGAAVTSILVAKHAAPARKNQTT